MRVISLFLVVCVLVAVPVVGASELFDEIEAGRVQILEVTGNGSSSGAALEAVLLSSR